MVVSVATIGGADVEISDEQLEGLGMQFRGAVLSPGDPGYDEFRAVENLAIDRRPGLIIRCTGPADVIDGVNLAREHGFLLALRAGGHHVGGHGTVEGGLLLDLRDMNGVWIDTATKSVRVQGGATWGQVDRETQQFGLVVPGGVVSTTGVAGLTLGGGIGWHHRNWGLSCDNLISAQVVLASGELVTASETENPDLFWGIRGGGGNFGVVTDFTFRAHTFGPDIAVAAVFHEAAAGEELLAQWRDLAIEAGDEVTTRAMYWSMPEADALPPPVQGKDVFIIGALYAGPPDKGAKVLKAFRDLGTPLADISDHIPNYRVFQAAFDELSTNHHSYWKSTYLNELTDDAMALIHERAMTKPDPRVLVHVPTMGGATAAVPPGDTAFGDRSAPFMLSVDGNTYDGSKFETVKAWVSDFIEQAQRLDGAAGGAYLNFSGDDAAEETVVQAQYGGNLERLRAVKQTYDPDNLFRVNNNIRPA